MAVETIAVPELKAKSRGATVLEKARVDVRIDRLFSVVTVEQQWRNPTKKNIEVVYTFPVASRAALLGLEVRIGGKTLLGQAVERNEAAERYEDAVSERKRAVLLEDAGDGLYTASVGNLGPGESATLRYTCAEVLRRQGDAVRFCLPTVIAPRYGTPALQPHQEPEYNHADPPERRYKLAVTVTGPLADADWSCPTHEVRSRKLKAGRSIALKEQGIADRDFVLEFRGAALGPIAALDRDCDGWTVLATFNPDWPGAEDEQPRALKVLVDCSGSMSGDSIAQARAALRRILDELRPGNRFNVIRFGSNHQPLFRTMMLATPANIERARAALARLEADLGGTEIGAALEFTARMPVRSAGMPADILLITDGEAWADSALETARRCGQRVFTVGVGSAPNAALIGQLAEASGGASEYATPGEDTAGRIVRQFRRMRAARAKRATVGWPGTPGLVVPATLNAVHAGDTVIVAATFAAEPSGEAVLRLELEDGTEIEQPARIEKHDIPAGGMGAGAPGPVARIVAAARLRTLTVRQHKLAVELATRYNLVSKFTSYLVVETAEGRKELTEPELVKIRQMTAAGWHGLGTVAGTQPHPDIRYCIGRESGHAGGGVPLFCRGAASDSQPMLCRRPMEERDALRDSYEVCDREVPRPPELPAWLLALNAAPPAGMADLPGLDDLEAQGLDEDRLTVLWGLVADGADEKLVVLAFLGWLAGAEAGAGLTPEARAAIAALRAAAPMPELDATLTAVLAD